MTIAERYNAAAARLLPEMADRPEGSKHRATCTGHGRAHKVNRFTRDDAERLARACDARAMFWRAAAHAEAATL